MAITQPSLDFSPTSDTSRDAHIVNLPHRPRDRERALTALRKAGERGLTDFELADEMSRDGYGRISQTSAGKRRLDLVRAGRADRRLVIDPETMRLVPDRRPSPTGAPAAVWALVEFVRPGEDSNG